MYLSSDWLYGVDHVTHCDTFVLPIELIKLKSFYSAILLNRYIGMPQAVKLQLDDWIETRRKQHLILLRSSSCALSVGYAINIKFYSDW